MHFDAHSVVFRTCSVGTKQKSKTLHAVMTCRIAVVIVSESFVQKRRPLFELAILGARLRLKENLDRKPKDSGGFSSYCHSNPFYGSLSVGV